MHDPEFPTATGRRVAGVRTRPSARRRLVACCAQEHARTHGGAPIGLARYAPPGSVGAQRKRLPAREELRTTCPAPAARDHAMDPAGGHLRRAGAPAECRAAGGTQRWTHGDPVAARAGTVSACPRAGTYRRRARGAASSASASARRATAEHVCRRSIDRVTRDAPERRSMDPDSIRRETMIYPDSVGGRQRCPLTGGRCRGAGSHE